MLFWAFIFILGAFFNLFGNGALDSADLSSAKLLFFLFATVSIPFSYRGIHRRH